MSIQTSAYRLRTYQKEDEVNLISLFNKAYKHFAGFIPRTLEYWRWCILSRPKLSEKGIVIAIADDQIVGYAAVQKSGEVLEFCYDSNCDGEVIASKLLEWCLNYAESQGASSVSLNAPVQDNIVRGICEENGFTEAPFASLFLRVLDIPYILREIAGQKKVEKDFDEEVLIDLKKFPSWCPQYVAVSAQDGKINVSTDKPEEPTIKIEADISTISSCIFGSNKTLYKAIFKRQLRIRPLQKIFKALKILSVLQLKNPSWFVPAADYG